MTEELLIDPKITCDEAVAFIRTTIKKADFGKAVIGLSGGIDSSTVFALTVKAIGAFNVFGVMLPYGDWQRQAVYDVKKLAGKLGVIPDNIIEINIKPFCDPILKAISSTDNFRNGNIMARMRMIYLYDLSKKYRALVMGTENKTEYNLGYFTRFGDEASDIEAVRHLYKTQIYQLANYLELPDEIIKKTPTAGLWPGQSDEGEFGFSYREADKILYLNIDKGMIKPEIIDKGFKKETVEKVLSRMRDNEFKHKLPYIISAKGGLASS